MSRTRRLSIALGVLGALAVACGGGGSDDAGGVAAEGKSGVTITSPKDGEQVSAPFTLTFESSEEIGPPESGKRHVHIFVDDKTSDYQVVSGTSHQISGLTPGEHTVHVTLQNADHSPAGAETEVKVMVTGTGGGAPAPSEPPDYGGGSGY